MAKEALLRAPQAVESVQNRQGIVEAPDVEPANDALDASFKELMGRDPTQLDHTPDRDRKESQDNVIETPSEMPEVDADPGETAAEEVDTAPEAAKGEPAAKPDAVKPTEDSFLDELLSPAPGKAAEKPAEKPADAPAQDTSAPDPYESVKLRSDASEKTKTTFEEVKRLARERESKAREEAEKIRADYEAAKKELEEAKKRVVPEEYEKELKELREFRAVFDAERDPEFNKRFQARREANSNAVYEVLTRNGLQPDKLEALKKLPYEQQIDQIARWAEKLAPRDKFAVSGRLADSENIERERQEALAEVKAKAEQILKEKTKAPEAKNETFVTEVVTTLKPVLAQLDFLHPKEAPATASPKEKQEIEQFNAKAQAAQQQLLQFLQDESPKTRGVLAVAGLLAPRFRQRAIDAEAKVAELEKRLGDVKAAGKLSRTTTGTAEKAAPRVDLFDTNAEDALEAHWKSMQ
jgi:hypothetical protein